MSIKKPIFEVSNSLLTIEYCCDADIILVDVCNKNGKILIAESFKRGAKIELNLSKLIKGIYTVYVICEGSVFKENISL